MHPNHGEDRTLFTPIKASTSISESETDLNQCLRLNNFIKFKNLNRKSGNFFDPLMTPRTDSPVSKTLGFVSATFD